MLHAPHAHGVAVPLKNKEFVTAMFASKFVSWISSWDRRQSRGSHQTVRRKKCSLVKATEKLNSGWLAPCQLEPLLAQVQLWISLPEILPCALHSFWGWTPDRSVLCRSLKHCADSPTVAILVYFWNQRILKFWKACCLSLLTVEYCCW